MYIKNYVLMVNKLIKFKAYEMDDKSRYLRKVN